MKENLTQNSTIGKVLCIVGIIALVIGVINLFIGFSDLGSISHYHKDIETITASLRIGCSIASGIAGLLLLGFSEVIRHLGVIASSSNSGEESDIANLPTL